MLPLANPDHQRRSQRPHQLNVKKEGIAKSLQVNRDDEATYNYVFLFGFKPSENTYQNVYVEIHIILPILQVGKLCTKRFNEMSKITKLEQPVKNEVS